MLSSQMVVPKNITHHQIWPSLQKSLDSPALLKGQIMKRKEQQFFLLDVNSMNYNFMFFFFFTKSSNMKSYRAPRQLQY